MRPSIRVVAGVFVCLFLSTILWAQDKNTEEQEKSRRKEEIQRTIRKLEMAIRSALDPEKLAVRIKALRHMIRLYRGLGLEKDAKATEQILFRLESLLQKTELWLKRQKLLLQYEKLLLKLHEVGRSQGLPFLLKLLEELEALERQYVQLEPWAQKKEKLLYERKKWQKELHTAQLLGETEREKQAKARLKSIEKELHNLPPLPHELQSLEKQLQHLQDEGVGAFLRGDSQRAKALASQIKKFQKELKALENRLPFFLKRLRRSRRQIQKLTQFFSTSQERQNRTLYYKVLRQLLSSTP